MVHCIRCFYDVCLGVEREAGKCEVANGHHSA